MAGVGELMTLANAEPDAADVSEVADAAACPLPQLRNALNFLHGEDHGVASDGEVEATAEVD